MTTRRETLKKFKELSFGTSGLRDTVINMTDMECYINARGFIRFLKMRGEVDDAHNVIALAGDRRSSTPRIAASVARAIEDEGCKVDYAGKLPSPTLAYYAVYKGIPSIMVTGSHIPDDRNGIKFTKKSGEVLKSDEKDILDSVARAREEEYGKTQEESQFTPEAAFKKSVTLPEALDEKNAIDNFVKRYTDVFTGAPLKGKRIVLYQHSAVGRDIIEGVFKALGGDIITVARSEKFVPVDTEKVSRETRSLLKQWANEYKPFAIISTDGDSDRPLLADEEGEFLTGDKLGALVSVFLSPDFAAVPISANDAVVSALEKEGIEVKQTKIGSPYVIAAMNEKLKEDAEAKVVSWESNGGFLLGSDWDIGGKTLKRLPTRDAVLPLVSALLLAVKENKSVSSLIASALPARYTHADVVDDKTAGCENYTADMGKRIIKMFSPSDLSITEVSFTKDGITVKGQKEVSDTLKKELLGIKEKLAKYFNSGEGFGDILSVNFIDGIRIVFSGGDVAHIRPSGNAPEFRMYATADTQERADKIVDTRRRIVPKIVADLAGGKS